MTFQHQAYGQIIAKYHNTIKVLIVITPQGVISFISECWGGRVSDAHLTEQCGILKKLLPGNIVLADVGFNIEDSVGVMQAKLQIPAFYQRQTPVICQNRGYQEDC